MKILPKRAALILALPALLLLPTVLMNRMPCFMDPVTQFYPYRCGVSRQVLSGRLPLWTSSMYAGMPLLANPQVAALYPGNWLFFLWPHAGIYTLLLALHVMIGGLGVYFWLRARQVKFEPALATALVVEVSSATWAHLAFGAYLNGMAIFPWCLFFLERFRRRNRPVYIVGMSVCAALLWFSGAPQLVYYAFLAFIALGIINLTQTRFSKRGIQDFLWLIFSLAIGTGLAAMQLIPTMELAGQSQRAGPISMRLIQQGSLNAKRILESFLGSGAFPQDPSDATYMGVMGVFFLLWGIPASFRKRRIGDLILLGAFLTLGLWPFSGLWAKLLPGFRRFHDPRRILALVPVLSAPLVARGLSVIWIKKKIPHPARLLLLFLGIFAVFFLWRGEHYNRRLWPALGWIPNLSFGGSIILSAAAVPCFLLADVFSRGKGRLWWNLLILLAALEILNYGLCRLDTKAIREEKIRPRRVSLLEPMPGKNKIPRIFAFDETGHYSYHYMREDFGDTWLPNLAATRGVSDFQGYDPLKPARYHLFLALLNEPYRSPYPSHFGIVRNIESPLTERAGITHAIGLPEGKVYKTWKKITPEDQPHLDLFKHQKNPGRFVFATEPEIVQALDEAVSALRIQALSGEIRGVIEAEKNPVRKEEKAGEAQIEVKEYREGLARIDVSAPQSGYLVFRESWFPGWRVFVNGDRRENLHADIAFQSVFLEKGSHRVTWRYQPSSWKKGVFLSLASLLVLFVVLVFARKRMNIE